MRSTKVVVLVGTTTGAGYHVIHGGGPGTPAQPADTAITEEHPLGDGLLLAVPPTWHQMSMADSCRHDAHSHTNVKS
jgi:hypothetical protein